MLAPNIQAAPGQFISLCGYAGAGKDVLAAHFLAAGYLRQNFGDVIKDFYDDFTTGFETVQATTVKILEHASTGVTEERVMEFVRSVLVPYRMGQHNIPARTENRELKPFVRPILEHGGELVYDHVMSTYNQTLAKRIAAGDSVINTRLCLIPEAVNNRQFGGELYLITRNNWEPASDWDADVIADLYGGNYIDGFIYNDSPSAEHWELFSREIAQGIMARRKGQAAA